MLEGGEGDDAEHDQDGDLEDGHRGRGPGTLPDAAHQQRRGHHHHEDGGQVDRTAVAGTGGERIRQLPSEETVEQFVDVLAPAHRHRGHGHAVLQEQAPADEEGRALAEGGVGEGVRAAGDGDGAAQLGERERGEDAGDGREDEGQHDGGAGLGHAVGQTDEDAGTDDRADPEAHQLEESHGALEPVALQVGAGLGDQLVRVLDAEWRAGQAQGAHGGGLISGSTGGGWCCGDGSGGRSPGTKMGFERASSNPTNGDHSRHPRACSPNWVHDHAV